MRKLRSFALITLLFATAATTGCGKKKDSAGTASGSETASGTDTTGSGSAAGTAGSGSASGTAGGGSAASGSAGQPEVNTPPPAADAVAAIDTSAMAHKAGNCPSTVAAANTAIEDAKDGKGVVLAITSNDKDAVWAIKTRAKHLVAIQDAPDAKIEHTGKGTGGGALGLCPVVTKDTKITVAEQADGVKVTMVPTGALKLDALKAEVADRIKKASELTTETVKPSGAGLGGGGTGGGAGKHGGNRTGKGDGSGPKTGKGGGKGSSAVDKQGGGNHM